MTKYTRDNPGEPTELEYQLNFTKDLSLLDCPLFHVMDELDTLVQTAYEVES